VLNAAVSGRFSTCARVVSKCGCELACCVLQCMARFLVGVFIYRYAAYFDGVAGVEVP